MAKIIDLRGSGGQLVLIGNAFALPTSDSATFAANTPIVAGSMRFNPTLNRIEYLGVDDDAWLDISTARTGSQPVTSVNSLTGAVVLTKSHVGLSDVDNTADAVKPISIAVQTALNDKQDAGTYATLVSGKVPAAQLPTYTKADVGLGNVSNTSDSAKPISNATQTALNAKSDILTSITTQAATSYTLALADSNKYIRTTSANAVTITVPTNATVAFPVGSKVRIIQGGDGQITFAGASGVVITTPDTLKTRKKFSTVDIIKVATDTWDLDGDIALT